jgi:hypothetical protein
LMLVSWMEEKKLTLKFDGNFNSAINNKHNEIKIWNLEAPLRLGLLWTHRWNALRPMPIMCT